MGTTEIFSEERQRRWAPGLFQLSAGRSSLDSRIRKASSSRGHQSHWLEETGQKLRRLRWLEFVGAEHKATWGKKLQKSAQGPSLVFGWIHSSICVRRDSTRPHKKWEGGYPLNNSGVHTGLEGVRILISQGRDTLEPWGISAYMSKGSRLTSRSTPAPPPKSSIHLIQWSFRTSFQWIKMIHR